ncbi:MULTISPECIES: T9SS type A sorting domain-containing protein [Chitinophagaceae]
MIRFLLNFFITLTITSAATFSKTEAKSTKATVDGCPAIDYVGYDLGVTENKLISKYYPNPARDYITFEFDKKIENNCTLVIYSFTGRKMGETQVSNLKITVNLSEYFRGLYMFQLISPKGQVLESGKFQVLK